MQKIFFLFIAVLLHWVFAQNIRVGSENTYKPFAYINTKNEATGYDNEVVKILVSYMPHSKLQFYSIPWNAIFTGLDSAKFDIVANQIAKTKEREEKYIFSSYPYFYGISGLIVGKDSKVTTMQDLAGAKIGVSVGSNHAANLEKFVKNNPNLKIKIVYYKTSPSLIADLASGRIAGMINDPIAARDYAKAQNVGIRVTDFYFEKVPIYLIFRKDSKELAKQFDVALQQAIKDGKIVTLAKEYFGEEYAKILQQELSKFNSI